MDDLIFTPAAKRHVDPWAYVFLAPALALLALFLFYPAVWIVFSSLSHEAGHSSVSAWINELESPSFWRAILNTMYFGAIYVPGSIVIGYVLARLISQHNRMRWLLVILFFLPVLLPSAAMGLVWRWMYNPDTGMVNNLLSFAGYPAVDWLKDSHLALPAIAVACVWQGGGLVAAILVVAIWAVPREFGEMATLDGAGGWRRLIHVDLPSVKPALVVSILLLVINALRIFASILVMTGDGGPGNWTTNLSFLVYRKWMKEFDLGGAAVLSILLCFSIILMVVLLHRYPVRGRES